MISASFRLSFCVILVFSIIYNKVRVGIKMDCCKMLKRETFLIFKNEKFSKKKILVYMVVFQKEY